MLTELSGWKRFISCLEADISLPPPCLIGGWHWVWKGWYLKSFQLIVWASSGWTLGWLVIVQTSVPRPKLLLRDSCIFIFLCRRYFFYTCARAYHDELNKNVTSYWIQHPVRMPWENACSIPDHRHHISCVELPLRGVCRNLPRQVSAIPCWWGRNICPSFLMEYGCIERNRCIFLFFSFSFAFFFSCLFFLPS